METENEATSAPTAVSGPSGQELPVNGTTLDTSEIPTFSSSPPSSSRSVLATSGPAAVGDNQAPVIQQAVLPKPPPLINTSSLSAKLQISSVPSPSSLVKDSVKGPVDPNVTPTLSSGGGISNPSTSAIKLEVDIGASQKIPPGGPPLNVGLGAGKLKAFMSMLNVSSTPKKQSTKKTGRGSGGRGQGGRTKPSPLGSGAASKKGGGEQAPSRSSNRNIKRPRTYDEEMDELKTTASFSKKAKAAPKVGY